MGSAYGILGHKNVSTTVVTAYNVPAATQSVVSSLTVCNTGTASVSFSAAVVSAGGNIGNDNYLYYNLTIPGNDTFISTVGITLSAGEQIRVVGDTATALSVMVFGVEIT